ncbi:hypothetical protein SprV_0702380600 [Sparganum proliferum]
MQDVIAAALVHKLLLAALHRLCAQSAPDGRRYLSFHMANVSVRFRRFYMSEIMSLSTVTSNALMALNAGLRAKMLVPNCTAGLVIGKLGSYVNEIKERTGAFIQISQKPKDTNLVERCITIAGMLVDEFHTFVRKTDDALSKLRVQRMT